MRAHITVHVNKDMKSNSVNQFKWILNSASKIHLTPLTVILHDHHQRKCMIQDSQFSLFSSFKSMSAWPIMPSISQISKMTSFYNQLFCGFQSGQTNKVHISQTHKFPSKKHYKSNLSYSELMQIDEEISEYKATRFLVIL